MGWKHLPNEQKFTTSCKTRVFFRARFFHARSLARFAVAITVEGDTRIVFMGDSITACNRLNDPEQLGTGYVRTVRDYLWAKDPATGPEVINRGISGNRVIDLEQRWQVDVLDLKPDIVSIKIGINDVWHSLRPNPSGVPIEQFRASYSRILTQLKNALPECTLILCEPSVIWPPAPAEGNRALGPYVEAVHEMASKFSAAVVVPLHAAFRKAKEARPDVVWAPDGVHPSSVGHMLIARTWLQACGLL